MSRRQSPTSSSSSSILGKSLTSRRLYPSSTISRDCKLLDLNKEFEDVILTLSRRKGLCFFTPSLSAAGRAAFYRHGTLSTTSSASEPAEVAEQAVRSDGQVPVVPLVIDEATRQAARRWLMPQFHLAALRNGGKPCRTFLLSSSSDLLPPIVQFEVPSKENLPGAPKRKKRKLAAETEQDAPPSNVSPISALYSSHTDSRGDG